MSLEGKVILVTGGTSGIGEGCSRHYAEVGAKVVIASTQEEAGRKLEETLRAEGRDARFVYTDVTCEESVRNLVAQAVATYGRIDGVHCNAGAWAPGKVTEFSDSAWNLMMGVNVKGVLWTGKRHPRHGATGQGVLLITTSSRTSASQHVIYASKAALEAIIRSPRTTLAWSAWRHLAHIDTDAGRLRGLGQAQNSAEVAQRIDAPPWPAVDIACRRLPAQ